MGDDQGGVAEGDAQRDEKYQKADAHEDFGHDHGDENEKAEGLLGGKAVAVEKPGGRSADDHGERGGGGGDNEAVWKARSRTSLPKSIPYHLVVKPAQ